MDNSGKINKNNRINKDMVPEGFTVRLALVDFLPVLFFGGIGVILGELLKNPLVALFSVGIFLSGLLKVIWKIIVAVKKKNVWPLFLQMRIAMPACFVGMMAAVIYSMLKIGVGTCFKSLLGIPQLIFFVLGLLGIVAMVFCTFLLDSADAKSNWKEQIINSAAQLCFFLGLLFLL